VWLQVADVAILRVLQSINAAKVVAGESTVTAAPFFESAGRPSKRLWGPQQGNKLIWWESLSAGEKEQCLKVLKENRMGYMVQGRFTQPGQSRTGVLGAQPPHLHG
jgi:hypothetical protein